MKLSEVKNISTLASYIAKKEKGKKEISIGNIREVLKLLSDASYKDTKVLKYIYKNGKRRGKKSRA